MSGMYSLNVPRTLEEACDPRYMALLVYNMQFGIASQLPHGSKRKGSQGPSQAPARGDDAEAWAALPDL